MIAQVRQAIDGQKARSALEADRNGQDVSWLGLRERRGGAFSTVGLGKTAVARVDPDAKLDQGTILLEFAAIPGAVDQVLLRYQSPEPLGLMFEIRLDLQGNLIITHSEIGTRRTYRIDAGFVTRSNCVSLRFTWDADQGIGGVSMEITETGALYFETLELPEPLVLRDAVRMFACLQFMQLANGVRFVAIADEALPHGPLPTLGVDTRINTDRGRKPVSDLKPGDVIKDVNGRAAQVRWVGLAEVPARGRFSPRQICAPFHGAKTDLICSHDQLLRLAGSEVEYLFATDFVAAKVGDLSHGVLSVPPSRVPLATYAQFVMDRPCVIDVSGVLIQGLDIQELQDRPDLRGQSVLANLPEAMIPTVSPARLDVLKPFETVAWSQMQAA